MKALSLKQPWATFVATGRKTIETRTWSTKYRGELLIVSSDQIEKNSGYNFSRKVLPLGKALAIVKLINCRPMRKEDEEAAMCSCGPGRYSWILSDIKKIKPFPVKGKLKIFEINAERSIQKMPERGLRDLK